MLSKLNLSLSNLISRSPTYNCAIIGGGFAGTVTTIRILQKCETNTRVAWFEKTGDFGPGLAFSTPDSAHILNVPAGKMSAFPETPNDFIDWIKTYRPNTTSNTFVERHWYGQYLKTRLREARETSKGILDCFPQEVTNVHRTGDKIAIRSTSQKIECLQVALCIGNFPANHPAFAQLSSKRYLENFYKDPSWLEIGMEESILILGTGLSMVDAVLSLKNRGHRGPIIAVSPSGRLPKMHSGESTPIEIPQRIVERANLRETFRWVREQLEEHPWPNVIDAFRPHTTTIWGRFSVQEKQKFLRHLKSLWNIHRHRIPESSHEQLKEMKKDGQLRILKERHITQFARRKSVDSSRHEQNRFSMNPDRIINCTGQESDPARMKSKLLQSMIEQGMIEIDPIRLGLLTDSHGFCVDHNGNLTDVATIGSLRRGSLWESTAVAELRLQAKSVCDQMAPSLSKSIVPQPGFLLEGIDNFLKVAARRQKRLAIWATCVGAFSLLLILQSLFPSLHNTFEDVVGPHSPWLMFAVFWAAFFCEFVDSSIGMGYGTTLTPVLLLMGFDPMTIVPSVIASELLSGIAAAYMHQRDGNVDFLSDKRTRSTVLTLGALSIIGAATAAIVAINIPKIWTTIIIGIIVVSAGVVTISLVNKKVSFSKSRLHTLGLLAAFNKGISGGGYGPLVSSGQIVSGMPARNAVAITSLAEGLTCLVALTAYLIYSGPLSYSLAFPLIAGALVSVPLATLVVRSFEEKTLQRLVGAFTCLFGSIILVKGLASLI